MGKKNAGLSKEVRERRKEENAQYGKSSSAWIYGLAFFALMFGAGMVQFILTIMDVAGRGYGSRGLDTLDVSNTDALREAFFSGAPHVIYCVSDKTEDQPVPELVVKIKEKLAETKGTEDVKMMKANCFKPMAGEGNRSIAKRFKFGKNESFLAIFANQSTPKMLNHLSKAKEVVKQIKTYVTPKLKNVVYLDDFKKAQQRKTVIIMSAKKKFMLNSLEEKFKPFVYPYRGVGFFSVDTGFWKLNYGQELTDTKPADADEKGEAVAMIKAKDDDLNDIWKQAYFTGDFDNASEVEAWVKMVQAGGADSWYSTKTMPKVKARPSDNTTTTTSTTSTTAGKFGGKEQVGVRQDSEEEEDEDDDFPDAGMEEEEEEVVYDDL